MIAYLLRGVQIVGLIDTLITILIISISVRIVFSYMIKETINAEKNMDINCFVVRQPQFAFWIGIICAAVFGVLIILMFILTNNTTEWCVYFVFSFFFLFGLLLALYCSVWEIRVNDNEIYYTCLLKNTKRFTFDDIIRVKIYTNTQYQKIALYSEHKKLLSLESNCIGYNVLLARLMQANIKFWQALTWSRTE